MHANSFSAFKLRKGLNLEKVIVKAQSDTDSSSQDKIKDQPQDGQKDGQTNKRPHAPLDSKAVEEYTRRKPTAIPTFSVTDDSHIEVASVQHEFSQSMAENHFDKTIFEAEATGVIKGVTLGGNYGKTNEKSSGNSEAEKKVEKTLVATYRVRQLQQYFYN